MNPIQIQLTITLDSDSIVDLLAKAIEKGTGDSFAKLLQAVRERPTHNVTTTNQSSEDDDTQSREAKLVDINTVAVMLGVSARMVWRLRDSGRMPKPVIIGRLIRWRKDAIEEWIQAGCPAVEQRGIKRK